MCVKNMLRKRTTAIIPFTFLTRQVKFRGSLVKIRAQVHASVCYIILKIIINNYHS